MLSSLDLKYHFSPFAVNNSAQQFSLKIITSPNVAFGGETFEVPPSVSVVNSLGQIDVNYIGSAYVAMGSSPTGFESLFIGNSCDQAGFCGDKVTRSNSVIPFHRGVATFQVNFSASFSL